MEGNANARRLPSWMMGGVAAPAAAAAADSVVVDGVGSGARRRKTGTTSRYRGGDDGTNDGVGGVRTKKKDKRERVRNDVAKKRSAKVGAGGPGSGDCTGEDVELTVEDLVSIAEEYVKADEDAKKEQLLQKERELRRVLPRAHSPQNVSEASVVVPDIEQKPEDSFRAAENPRSEQTLLSTTISTGDPARDMLDLFLGPLLKKPVDDQKNTNFGGNDLDFAFKSVRQSQNNVGEGIVAPVKKKGSFKDKVYSLLD